GGELSTCLTPVLAVVQVFVLLFIFVKRQIMRFAMKSRRGPHVPVGQHAPKDLKEEIDIRLSRVQDIKYEPWLLAEDDSRLLQLETQGCYNYLYRMKALDAIRTSEIPFHAEGRYPKSLIGKNFCAYLLELRNSSTSFKGIRKALIDTLLDGYESAFGKPEYLKYQDALNELANLTKVRGGSSQWQHQSAAKDLTLSPEVSNPQTCQTLPGAEELQGQLQHAGEHPVSCAGSTAPGTCHKQSPLLGAAGVLGRFWPQFTMQAALGGSSCALGSPFCTMLEIVAQWRLRPIWLVELGPCQEPVSKQHVRLLNL
uniref:Chromosome 1 open reading frame 43 n=1 Tax=Buteo japonicus TaxID=224669 RepID=A0A8C0BH92_9AVES